MNNIVPYNDIKDFFLDIFTLGTSVEGGSMEMVTDFNTSQYYNPLSDLDELITSAISQAQNGHQMFFGPAARSQDLGTKRSTIANIDFLKVLWVDIDSPDKTLSPEERLAEAKKLLEEFLEHLRQYGIKPSYIVESGHGYHVYFVLKRFNHPNDSAWKNSQNALTKLAKGDKLVKQPAALLRVPGTYNLKDPNNPRPVKIIENSRIKYELADFGQLVADLAKKYQESLKAAPTEIGHKKLGFIPPCIQSLLDPSKKPPMGTRHLTRLVLSIFAFHEGWELQEAITKMRHTTDDPQKAESDIKNSYKVLERDPERYKVGCSDETMLRELVNAGVAVCDEKSCQFKQPAKKTGSEKPEEHIAMFEGLVDVVLDEGGKPNFLVKDNGSLFIRDKQETDDRIFTPPPSGSIIWQPPRASEVLKYVEEDNDEQLFKDLVEYHRGISELPNESYYFFIAIWVMHTYLHEKFQYSPIIWFYAIAGRGKSRTSKGMLYAAWRGVIQTTVHEAHIIRLATHHNATIFFDIMDLWQKVMRSNTDDILLNRFEQGAQIARIMYPDKGRFRDTVWFSIYGPTLIASNKVIDDILETRSIQIVMPETTRIFENDEREIDALPFRERLTAFRARWIDQQLPSVTKPAAGRLGDILKPMRQIVAVSCSDESWFMDFAHNEEISRKRSGSDSDEGKVVSAIQSCLGKVENGHLFHKDILGVLNSEVSERNAMDPRRLGRITKRLGFESYTSGNLRGIYINEELLNSLCSRYGIQIGNGTLTV